MLCQCDRRCFNKPKKSTVTPSLSASLFGTLMSTSIVNPSACAHGAVGSCASPPVPLVSSAPCTLHALRTAKHAVAVICMLYVVWGALFSFITLPPTHSPTQRKEHDSKTHDSSRRARSKPPLPSTYSPILSPPSPGLPMSSKPSAIGFEGGIGSSGSRGICFSIFDCSNSYFPIESQTRFRV